MTPKTKENSEKKTQNPMTVVYANLKKAGVERSYIKKYLLPEWWEDDMAIDDDPLFFEITLGLARRLSVTYASLINPDATLVFKLPEGIRFKKNNGKEISEATLGIIREAARLSAEATPVEYIPEILSAKALRERILNRGAASVNLETLLNECWAMGIPVLFLPEYPGTKPDGVAFKINGRPVIIIGKAHKYSAWLLFILAHEIGHILCGHLQDKEFILDESIFDEGEDVQEKEANDFAKTLILGKATQYNLDGYHKPEEIVAEAQKKGQNEGIDPGALLLNVGWGIHQKGQKNGIPFALKLLNLLNLLNPNPEPPRDTIRKFFSENIDYSAISYTQADYLDKIAGETLEAK